MAPPPEHRSLRIIEDRWSVISRITQTVALALAGLWGFYTFFYQERIKPASAEPNLEFTFRLERAGTIDGSPVIRTAMHFHNGGTVVTDVYAEGMNVFGVRYRAPHGFVHQTRSGEVSDDASMVASKPELIFASSLMRDAVRGGAHGRHILLRPGASFDSMNYLVLPRGKFQAVTAECQVLGGRSVESGSLAVTRTRKPDGSYVLNGGFGGSNNSDYLVL